MAEGTLLLAVLPNHSLSPAPGISFIRSSLRSRCCVLRRGPSAGFLVCLLLALGCTQKPGRVTVGGNKDAGQEELAGPALFEDITAASGVKFTYRNGEDTANHLAILESLGGGVG